VTERVPDPVLGDPRDGFSFSSWRELPLPAEVVPVSRVREPAPEASERVLAALMLLVSLPVTVLVALLIKVESPTGPVFYRQERVGVDRRGQPSPESPRPEPPGRAGERRRRDLAGRPFWIFKFRTMIPDAEKGSGPVWATENDPRITRVGRILRLTRLDEVPQLINVMRGEMRLIGPRPERPHFVAKLSREIPEYPSRLKVPPGITGLAQVEKHYDETLDDVRTKVKYDCYYAKHRSVVMDVKILVKTIDVVLRGRGAR